MAREPFFPSLLGGVWLDGLWHQPLGLRECLPTHVPPPLSCLCSLSSRDCPHSSPPVQLPPCAPSIFTNLIPESANLFATFLLPCLTLASAFLPTWNVTPSPHTVSHFWAPAKLCSTLACFILARVCSGFASLLSTHLYLESQNLKTALDSAKEVEMV